MQGVFGGLLEIPLVAFFSFFFAPRPVNKRAGCRLSTSVFCFSWILGQIFLSFFPSHSPPGGGRAGTVSGSYTTRASPSICFASVTPVLLLHVPGGFLFVASFLDSGKANTPSVKKKALAKNKKGGKDARLYHPLIPFHCRLLSADGILCGILYTQAREVARRPPRDLETSLDVLVGCWGVDGTPGRAVLRFPLALRFCLTEDENGYTASPQLLASSPPFWGVSPYSASSCA